jgi:hypothetical protein
MSVVLGKHILVDEGLITPSQHFRPSLSHDKQLLDLMTDAEDHNLRRLQILFKHLDVAALRGILRASDNSLEEAISRLGQD